MSPADSANAAAAVAQARLALQQGRIDEAIAALQGALSRDPRSADAYELLGIAFGQRGQINESIQSLMTAVNLNPGSATARVNLAAALQRAGRIQEAAGHLSEALRVDPLNQRARQALSMLQGQGQAVASATLGQPSAPRTGLAGAQVLGGPQPPTGAQPLTGEPYTPQPAYNAPPSYAPPAQGYAQPGPYGQQPYTAPAAYGRPQPYGYQPYSAQQGYARGQYEDIPDWSPANILPILTNPREFFRGQRNRVDLGGAVAYAGLWMAAVMLIQIINLLVHPAPSFGSVSGTPAYETGRQVGTVVGAAFGGAIVLVLLFVYVGFYHLFVMAFGGRAGYTGTYRAMIYSWTPVLVVEVPLLLINLLAPEAIRWTWIIAAMAVIWAFVVLVIGYQEVHELSAGAAFGAAFVPGAIIVGILVAIFVAMAAFFASLMGSAPHGLSGSPGFPGSQGFPGGSPNFPRFPGSSGGMPYSPRGGNSF